MTYADIKPFHEALLVQHSNAQGMYTDEATLGCPVCGFPHFHMTDNRAWGFSEDGYFELHFQGECGHAWVVAFRRHAGTTQLELRLIDPPSSG